MKDAYVLASKSFEESIIESILWEKHKLIDMYQKCAIFAILVKGNHQKGTILFTTCSNIQRG